MIQGRFLVQTLSWWSRLWTNPGIALCLFIRYPQNEQFKRPAVTPESTTHSRDL